MYPASLTWILLVLDTIILSHAKKMMRK